VFNSRYRQEIFALPLCRDWLWGPPQAFCTMDAGGLVFTKGVKQQGLDTDHTSPSGAEVKIGGAIPPLPHTSSWHGC
jgi:hypothetical protein